MNRIDHHSIGHLGAGVGMTHERPGSLAGEQVRVKSAISVLEDAREEISMHHSEKVEAKVFGERRIAGGRPGTRLRIEQIEAYLEATRQHRDPRKLQEALTRLQTSRHPREQARREARAPAQQFALLQLALQDARKRLLPAQTLEQLEDALEDLEQESGDQIHAGLNTAVAAADFAPTAEGVETFQQAYTDIVLGEPTFAKTLQLVLQRLAGAEGEDFKRALKALLCALGADLSAARSSTDPVRLQALVQDVYQLEVAGTVLDGCAQLSQRMASQFNVAGVIPLALMQELVALTTERWITPQRLRALAQRFLVAHVRARIAFHTGTKTLLRKMPTKVFADAESREGVLGSVQLVLDEDAAEEEEGYGA
jgi:type III secretion protein W